MLIGLIGQGLISDHNSIIKLSSNYFFLEFGEDKTTTVIEGVE